MRTKNILAAMTLFVIPAFFTSCEKAELAPPMPGEDWHLENAHIPQAWSMGYAGEGIKIGVIDFNGFDYNHPDLQGQLLPGWDCIQNAPYDASSFYFTDNEAHGTAVCGIIAAKANGTGATGVAYDAKIVPFLIDGSESSIILAMRKAMSAEFDVDVLNLSFAGDEPIPAIEMEIKKLVSRGRVRNGKPLGIVVTVSNGNINSARPYYPAAYDEVISVAASTPDDRKKTPGDGLETTGSWGSNYGPLLDIAAPGVHIYTTDLSGANGWNPNGDYIAFGKTSSAAPIISGVAALVLSKNPNLNWQEVKTILENSADKTGGYDYSYDLDKPGHSMEMGYGKVNAERALAETVTGLSGNHK